MSSASDGKGSEERSLSAGDVVGRYRIVRRLGSGAMGEVYEVTRTEDGAKVALKILSRIAQLHDETVRRFHREASVCATLRHRNVVPVIDHGVWEQRPFLVMPVLRGADLETLIARVGALAPEVAVAIALEAARGLSAAHDASIVHRDFKPANVFLDEDDDGRVTPIVCDFGVAKSSDVSGELTATGAVIGTPLYMAPEQLLDSKRVDLRCDVWALGMTLYHMLAGRSAFADLQSFAELLVAMREEKIPPLQRFAPWVVPSLARAVHAMLLPAERRVGTTAEAIAVLERSGVKPARLTKDALTHVSPAVKACVATVALVPQSASELSGQLPVTGPERPSTATTDPFIERTINERYRIRAKIGTGGMGAVYEAIDLSPVEAAHGEVAIKVMLHDPAHGDPEATRRFLREAKAAVKIASPYVARVLDSGVDSQTGSPFLVMELLRGGDLATLVRREGPIQSEPVVSLFLHACEALSAAHALGIVHRDIKPSNLFLHELADGTVVLKVCDFGIAKQITLDGAAEASAELTRTGGLLGSPMYMSPEQAKSAKNVDARSDVFSLALSLHEALSGRRPWSGLSSMGEIIVAVCTEDVPSLSVVAPWVDPALASVIDRGLVRDATRRFQTVAAFADALRPFGLGRPVRRTDLTAARADRRAVSSSARSLAPEQSGAALPAAPSSAGSITSQPASMSTSQPSRGTPMAAVVALGVVLVGGLATAAGLWARRGHADSTPAAEPAVSSAVALASSQPPEHASAASIPTAAPSATASGAVETPDAASSAERPVAPSVTPRRIVPPPASTTTSVATATHPTASAAPTASSPFGRGGTATELPP